MAIAWQTPGAVSSGSSVASPAYPASPAAGDLLLLMVGWGNSTNVAPATPAGWTAPSNNNYVGGANAFAVDDGPRGVTIFTRESDGTESGTVTVTCGGTGTTRAISAQIGRLTKSAAAWTVTVVGGSDTSSGTAFSVTAGSDPGAVNGDVGVAVAAWALDTGTPTSPDIVWTGTGTGVTNVQSVANAQGNDLRFLIYRRALTGTSSAAPTFSATVSSATAGSAAVVLIHEGAGATPTVEPDDAAHAHAATSPTLTQHQVLAVANAAHAHAATSPTLVQHQVLAPANGAHAHAATSPTLTQHQALLVDSAAHAHAATSPALTQHQALAVDGSAHAHAATSPSLTQHQVLAVDGGSHAHAATSPTVTPVGSASVVPADALHTHSASSPTLVQHQALSPPDSAHAHAATSPTLTQHHALTVADALHAHAATSPAVTPRISVTPPATRRRATLAQVRTTSTPAENRSVTTYAEDRTVITRAEDRSAATPAERRSDLELAENRTT